MSIMTKRKRFEELLDILQRVEIEHDGACGHTTYEPLTEDEFGEIVNYMHEAFEEIYGLRKEELHRD